MAAARRKKQMMLPFAAMAGLAGCGSETGPALDQPAAARLPDVVCQRSARTLEELRARGTFEYSSRGEATIDQELWLQLGAAGRDGLGAALGYHAACSAAEPPRESQITIRGETGQVLDSRIVPTVADPGLLGSGADE